MPVIECDPAAARQSLEAAGVDVGAGNTEHELWRAGTDDATAVAYEGKVVVQGRAPERLAALIRTEGSAGQPDSADRQDRGAEPGERAGTHGERAGTHGERAGIHGERAEAPGRRSGRAHVYFDGASRGNPGPAAVGWVVVTDDGIVSEGGKSIGRATNNRAEYEALITALEMAADLGFDEVRIRGDSELVVRQVRGEWDANDPALRERRVRVHELLDEFGEWSIDHVPREINERADELANDALDAD